MNEIMVNRGYMEYDKAYSGMVSAFVPWNVFTLVFVPFYACLRKPVAFNEFVLHVCYLPLTLFLSMLFLVFNIVLILPTYFMCIAMKVFQLTNPRSNKSMAYRVG